MSGRYRLLGQIETGELAELYAASRDGQPVVVKLFHTQTTDARYAQELAEIARQLQTVPSDGIARYVELGLVKGRLAVVREDVQGLTLGLALQRLASKEVLIPTPVTLAFLIELLDAVQLAHDAGVVHGAITPGNVFIRPDGRPVLLDFGALRALQAVPALKKVFPARGRSAYRAQEVTRGETPNELSDVYSVGAIAYELLTLREATSGNLANVSTRREPLPPPSRLDRRLNSRIDPIVMRALDQQATRRFRSCAEFAGALRNFLTDNGGMPLREDVQRVVRDLSHGRPGLGPVPFSEPFTLQEVEGAELPSITERSVLLAARPSFSSRDKRPPPDDAETMEGAPAFEEYKPDPRYDDPEPGEEPDPDYDDGKPGPPVPLDEALYPDTVPGQAPPRRQGSWDAPPGAAPRAPRRSMSLSQPAVPARPPVKNPRMRVREDFDAESESEENPFDEQDQTDPNLNRKRAARPEPDESLPEDEPPGLSPVQKLPEVSLSKKLAGLAAPSGELDLRASPSELLDSAMAAQAARRRKRMVTIAVALALVGVVGLAFAVRRKGDTGPEARRDRRPDPAARTIDGALRKYEEPRRSDPPAPRPAPAPVPAPPPVAETTPAAAPEARQLQALEEEDITAYEPPDRGSAAFLTVLSDLPATVTIDGFRVKKTTPLFKFPVEPGTRRITIEAIATQERRTLELTFEKGKLQRVDERFRRPQ